MSKRIGSGLFGAILDAIHGSDERIGGQPITSMTGPLLEADTSISVTSTIGFGEWQDGVGDAMIVIAGEQIYCSGRTNTSFTGLTRGLNNTKVLPVVTQDNVVYDISQNTSAIDLARRGFLVDYAVDEDLTTVGRNLGMHRCPGIDDTIYRSLIKAIAYLAKQPPSAIVTAMTALVGSSNFRFYERLVTQPNRFFVEVSSPPAATTHGHFYLNSGEAHTADGSGQVVVDYDIVGSPFLGAASTGNIRVVSGAFLSDAEGFTLSDGFSTVVFEFDSGGGVGGGNIPVPFTATSSEVQVRDAIITAISGSGLGIVATATDAQNVGLTSTTIGVAGNIGFSWTVFDSVFAITSVAGQDAGTIGVIGIYDDNELTREGVRDGMTNYFTGGSYATATITPGTPLAPGTAVLVDYSAFQAHYTPDIPFVNDGTHNPPYFSDNLAAAACVLDQVRAAGVGVVLSAKP